MEKWIWRFCSFSLFSFFLYLTQSQDTLLVFSLKAKGSCLLGITCKWLKTFESNEKNQEFHVKIMIFNFWWNIRESGYPWSRVHQDNYCQVLGNSQSPPLNHSFNLVCLPCHIKSWVILGLWIVLYTAMISCTLICSSNKYLLRITVPGPEDTTVSKQMWSMPSLCLYPSEERYVTTNKIYDVRWKAL